MKENIKLIATTTFGLEAVVKRELKNLGYENLEVTDGKIKFEGDLNSIPKCNLWLRSADRVLLNVGEFKAYSFEELFQNVKSIDWGKYIPINGNFIINAKSVKSQLYSLRDCQSISEKAIVEKLKLKYDTTWFEKDGAKYKILISILKDNVTVSIDTSGEALHKRGYRKYTVTAPLKETLASAMINLSYWNNKRILVDPTCGSGTILIESALIGKNIAPGLYRNFESEKWEFINKKLWEDERNLAKSQINNNIDLKLFGYDMDYDAIQLAKANSIKANIDDCITFETKKFNELQLNEKYGVIICNPPYGERVGNLLEVEELYKNMGELMKKNDTWSFYVITSHEDFEKLYGKKANAKRKLYNGKIKSDYYQYYGERPPKNFYD